MVQGSVYFHVFGEYLVEVDMPIYEYQCSACGQSHDALQKLSDAPLVDCPECGQPELKKKISAAGFRLTGGGWYETDFKTGDKKKNLSGDSQSSGADKPAASDKASEPKKPASSKTESAI
jgi:putative FmdB family regulatory protein